jgi:hypothetical protein
MSLFTKLSTDAADQRLFLAVINDTGAEQLQYGRLELRLRDIRAVLAATTPTAVAEGDEYNPANVKFREIQVCLDDGTQAFAVILMGGLYTKA